MERSIAASRRRRWASLITALALAGALAVAVVGWRASAVNASSSGSRTIRLVATRDRFKIVRKGNIGGESFDRYQLTDRGTGEHVGTAYGHCYDTWDEQVFCDIVLAFYNQHPWGQIVLGGDISLVDNHHRQPVLGGTGSYTGAKGVAVWVFRQSDVANLTISLSGNGR